MLESPLSLRLLHDLISTRKRTLSRATYVGKWSTFSTTRNPEPIVREKMMPVWDKIAQNNRWYQVPTFRQLHLPARAWSVAAADNGQHGPRIEIEIHLGFIQDPVSAIQHFPAAESRVLHARFDYARTLCYEIAHVVDFARDADRRQRLFDDSDQKDWKVEEIKTEAERCAELGDTCAWECDVSCC